MKKLIIQVLVIHTINNINLVPYQLLPIKMATIYHESVRPFIDVSDFDHLLGHILYCSICRKLITFEEMNPYEYKTVDITNGYVESSNRVGGAISIDVKDEKKTIAYYNAQKVSVCNACAKILSETDDDDDDDEDKDEKTETPMEVEEPITIVPDYLRRQYPEEFKKCWIARYGDCKYAKCASCQLNVICADNYQYCMRLALEHGGGILPCNITPVCNICHHQLQIWLNKMLNPIKPIENQTMCETPLQPIFGMES